MKWTRFATVMVFWDAQCVRGATAIEWSTTLIPMGDWVHKRDTEQKTKATGAGSNVLETIGMHSVEFVRGSSDCDGGNMWRRWKTH
jgi:hypothetical protein